MDRVEGPLGLQAMGAIENFYERYWSQEDWNPAGRVDNLLRAMLDRRIPNNASVVEIGCGDASGVGRRLTEVGCDYLGFDVSPTAVERARATGIRAEVHDLSAPLPTRSASVDAAIAIEVIEHLIDPQFMLEQCRRILKRRGVLVLSTPNAFYLRRRLEYLVADFRNLTGSSSAKIREAPWVSPHIRFFSWRSLRTLLEVSGFEIQEADFYPPYFLESLPYLAKLRNVSPLYRLMNPLDRWMSRRYPSLFASGFYVCAIPAGQRPPTSGSGAGSRGVPGAG